MTEPWSGFTLAWLSHIQMRATPCLPLRGNQAAAFEFKVNVASHQTQKTTDFVDGSNAAKEAHGHRQGTHSDEDV